MLSARSISDVASKFANNSVCISELGPVLKELVPRKCWACFRRSPHRCCSIFQSSITRNFPIVIQCVKLIFGWKKKTTTERRICLSYIHRICIERHTYAVTSTHPELLSGYTLCLSSYPSPCAPYAVGRYRGGLCLKKATPPLQRTCVVIHNAAAWANVADHAVDTIRGASSRTRRCRPNSDKRSTHHNACKQHNHAFLHFLNLHHILFS